MWYSLSSANETIAIHRSGWNRFKKLHRICKSLAKQLKLLIIKLENVREE
jgi:hypothetical protein